MKNFISVNDVADMQSLISQAIALKKTPFAHQHLGKNKTIGLLFLNPSLRTRMSTQKAAYNLGMNVMVLNLDKDSWQLEFEDGAVMNSTRSEHIKEAAAVISQYCDIVGLRAFPSLTDKEKDDTEQVLNAFMKYCTKPVVSLESATRHPLQSFADMITITENWTKPTPPKVVLTWAPHIKALPQAVPNSFAEWAVAFGANVTIAQPKGYELSAKFTRGATISYNQKEAIKDADFIYVKNWSSYNDYGAMPEVNENWLLDLDKFSLTNNAKIMHCLPVRRNVELIDGLIDSTSSLIQQQAGNRVWAAQSVLYEILNG